MEQQQVLIVSFHVSSDLLELVKRQGLIYNRYQLPSDPGLEGGNNQSALSISFLIDVTGIDRSTMGLDPHVAAEQLGLPGQAEWDWYCDVCDEDALPAGSYWIGDIHKVACAELKKELPGYEQILAEAQAGTVVREIESFPGLFYAVFPSTPASQDYYDTGDGKVYRCESGCIGIIPKVLVEDTSLGLEYGDFINCNLQMPIEYSSSSGSMKFDAIILSPVQE